jgi:hypothetical protein
MGNKPKVDPGKVRLLTLMDLDARTRAAKHAQTLQHAFVADLGKEPSTAEAELCQRAAMAGTVIEDMEASYLAGHGLDVPSYTALINCQRRVMADLGLERRPRDVTPSIDSYLANKSDEG